ncbi:MAG: SLBB domain-containing protein [Candidatus Poribacteria bacterium]|nr:SLBB domain-containing protein [Candidatus Poribacteria bacterium]
MIYFLRRLHVSHWTFRCLQAHTILLFLIVTTPLFSEVYRIKKGDTLLIAVVGQPEYTHSAQVREDGRISYFGGDLDVAGQTVETVNQQIREFLISEGLIRNPVVMVSPVLQENGVFVGGAVKLPGRYPISPETDIGLYRAITLAGGLAENADHQVVQLIRTDIPEKVEIYDLSPTHPYRDIRVSVNDLVFVMPLSVVEVQGQVQTPGKLFIRGQISLKEALARAGGPTQEADLTAIVRVEKNGSLSEFNLAEQFWRSTPNDAPLPSLSDGDVLFVPNVFKVDPIYVIGYVREPGAQRVRGPLTIARAIALSGGFDAAANREEIRIHRRDGTNQEVLFTFDAVENEEQPILLYPGDVLEVKKKFEINWNLVSTIVYILATGVSLVVNLTN